MNWSLRACGRRGHETYAPTEPELRARLTTQTAVGEAWRCLRCGDFVLGPPAGDGPADEAPVVLRDRALRDAVVLRVLAVERFVRGLVLLGLSYGVLRFRASQRDLRATFERAVPALRPLQDALHVDLTDSAIVLRAQKVLASRPHTLGLLSAGLLAYGLLQLLEGVGLFLLKRWGEYVAAVGTSLFLPLEVRELLDRVTVLRLGAFLLNVAAVLYLVLTKRLFGVRGGRAAFEAERQQESLLEVEQAATA
ncbi:MAG: DUF2127 domain-containing protein [Actinobacteria bacterium]|nr:DUF2127 domain-containing protein [Actinomycetota bacterium]MCA1721671.1 DUF2127 domain-containing protein [Actinomycetota bacterium]